MALKDRLRSKQLKRFGNVANHFNSKFKEMSFSSTESESESATHKNKVRGAFTTKRLMKESECYTVDNDHIYTSLRSCGSQIRKRKISEDTDEKPVKKQCFSKNAVMARLNRERKKKYVSSLESENETLRKENNEMMVKISEQNHKISLMKREILYLKGLLANSTELGQILKNFKETTGLPVTSSMIQTGKAEVLEKCVDEQKENQTAEHQPRIREKRKEGLR